MARPAVLFETAPPVAPDVLPRMDVAAFVGLASAGPIDVPVAIEDMSQFREIFGDEPELAFDAERGEMQRGYLSAAVEAFLANGGRRCWIVRVADTPDTISFELNGLTALQRPQGPFESLPIQGIARSPGAWAQGLRVHTTLIENPLLIAVDEGHPAFAISIMDSERMLSLDVNAAPGSITRGEMIRLQAPPLDLQIFMVVDRVDSVDRTLRLSASQWCLARVVTESTPIDPALRSDHLEIVDLTLLDTSSTSPWMGSAVQADLLSFEISTWRGDSLESRMADLEFSPLHPRFWGNLPNDDALFLFDTPGRADARDDELLALANEARGNRKDSASQTGKRFAFSSATRDFASGSRRWPIYLPNGMSRLRRPEDSQTLVPTAPIASGNERLIVEMFVDTRLSGFGGDSLLRSAEQIHSQARDFSRTGRGANFDRLRGIHSLIAIDEVTLIATPDAVHRGWSHTPRLAKLLDAPDLVSAAYSISGQELQVEWSVVVEANAYLVQLSQRADFSTIEVETSIDASVDSLSTLIAHLAVPPVCNETLYVRVGARRYGEPSPWSNTLAARPIQGAFQACERIAVDVMLTATITPWSSSDASPALAFSGVGTLESGTQYEVQSAGDVLFASDIVSQSVFTAAIRLPEIGEGLSFWRVRLASLDHADVGAWSNTIAWLPPSLARPVLDPAPRASSAAQGSVGFDDSTLLAIHRGLLRFSQARGDLLALLSVPRHYGPIDAADYLAAIAPNADLSVQGGSTASRALTFGESPALSHGAVFYPWCAHRVDVKQGRREPRFTPCDGIAAAQLAQIALARGAWIASANRPLRGVLALDPRLSDENIDQLHDMQVNVLFRSPTGFVFIDDQTLSIDSDTRPISVRRLLILVKRLALREGAGIVFEPNDIDLQERVYTDFERVLSTLHQRGAFKGVNADEAFNVIADASINPQASVDLGKFIVELRIAPSEPLKFLRVRLVQNGPQSLTVGEG